MNCCRWRYLGTYPCYQASQEKSTLPPPVQPYYDERGQLIESGGLVFRGEQLVVPLSLPRDKLTHLHSSHIGIGGCVRRARKICIGQE